MPGNTVKYPENEVGSWYRQRLAQDNLEDCRFRVSSLKLNLPGCYRPLLAFPRNLRYRLHGAAAGEGGGSGSSSSSSLDEGQAGVKESKEDSPALTLNFDLDSSCYATICLREIMKVDL